MKYERFEQLPVWQTAMNLTVRIFALTKDHAFRDYHKLRHQFHSASVSVCNNIAEGFERGTTKEMLTFIYIARGSAGEVRSMLLLVQRLPGFGHLKPDVSELKCGAESVSRQLSRWAQSLQNSPIKGWRYLTKAT